MENLASTNQLTKPVTMYRVPSVVITNRANTIFNNSSVNRNNLVPIQTTTCPVNKCKKSFVLINARSVRNKSAAIFDVIPITILIFLLLLRHG